MSKYIDEESLILTAYDLRDVFQNIAEPEQAVQAIKQIIGNVNIVDPTEREGSPWRNRPLNSVLSDQKPSAQELERRQHFAELREAGPSRTRWQNGLGSESRPQSSRKADWIKPKATP